MKRIIFIILPLSTDSTVDLLETLTELNGSDYATYENEVVFMVENDEIDHFSDTAYLTAKESGINITLYDGKPELGNQIFNF